MPQATSTFSIHGAIRPLASAKVFAVFQSDTASESSSRVSPEDFSSLKQVLCCVRRQVSASSGTAAAAAAHPYQTSAFEESGVRPDHFASPDW